MAGNPKCWPKYWSTTPRQFWYLYPSKEVATIEFEKKWVPEFMPAGSYKDHPTYGWTMKYKHGYVHELKFNTGVSIYFKAYSQDVQRLQSGTVHAIFCDEELPIFLLDELMLRVAAVDGLFMMVFTATMGQTFWRNAIEKIGKRGETMKGGLKMQVTMYDCLEYEDGDKHTPWTVKKIAKIKNKCSTKAQILRRVYGRFVVDEGLIYKSFVDDKNVISRADFKKKNNIQEGLIPKHWEIYGAADIGSGGDNHPAALVFIMVRPDYKYGAVFRGRRLDDVGTTTSSDVLEAYRLLRGNLKMAAQCYDYEAKDFETYAIQLGESFDKANKSKTAGEDLVNVLFKNKMLDVICDDPEEEELGKLIEELQTLRYDMPKQHAKDDFVDSLRYDVKQIPWDYTGISDEYVEVETKKGYAVETDIELRRKDFDVKEDTELEEIEDEIGFYNDLYEG